jgi:hypothetical protein
MNNQAQIQALETELAGYVRRGLSERAHQVQQELIRLGRPMDTPFVADVPSESDGTPTKPATRVRTAPEPSKPEPPAKATAKKRRS